MTKLWPLTVFVMVVGCNPPGEHSKQLIGGYEWIKHDGESQVITADGNIKLEHVTQARTEGAMIETTVENGAAFEIDTRTGQVRTISGEMQ